jgi:hypothetical protein
METVTCRCVATAVAVTAAGLIISTPVATPPPTAQLRDIALTSGSDVNAASTSQLGFNSSLIEGFLSSNTRLVDAQHDLTPELVRLLGGRIDPDGTPHGLAKDAVEQFFNASNAFSGIGQNLLLSLLGARGTVAGDGVFTSLDPESLNASLVVDPRHTGTSEFAGLESAIGHYIGAAVFLNGFLNDIPEDVIEGDATYDNFTKMVTDTVIFNQALLDAEKVFSTSLVRSELDLERALFGTDSALGGVVNHVFNAFNMHFDIQQQSLNGLLGVTGYDPQAYTAALLTGGDGTVGGVLGMLNQGLAATTGLFGLLQGASTGAPDGFRPDPAAVGDAFQVLVATLAGSPFGDVFDAGGPFADLLADLHAMV